MQTSPKLSTTIHVTTASLAQGQSIRPGKRGGLQILLKICSWTIFHSGIPQCFWHPRLILWKTIFPWTGEAGGNDLGMIWAHYIYCALYFYCYNNSSTSDHQALDTRGWGPLFYRLQSRQVKDTSSRAGHNKTQVTNSCPLFLLRVFDTQALLEE